MVAARRPGPLPRWPARSASTPATTAANHAAHALVRQALTGNGDIDPGDGIVTVRLDPLPTRRATTANAELWEHLTATHTGYPAADLVFRYEAETHV